MDAALNKKSLMFGIPGIALQILGNVVGRMGGPNATTGQLFGGLAITLIGTILLIAGLSWYAKAKGHSGWWGLMGFLSCIGLIVLACLPDRLKVPK